MAPTSEPSSPKSRVPSIAHPRHALILAPSQTSTQHLPPFLHALTSAPPADTVTSFTGYTSHPPLQLRTSYYKADVGVWCDEIPATFLPFSESKVDSGDEDTEEKASSRVDAELEEKVDNTDKWSKQFQGEEAKEVLTAIGAVVLILSLPPPTSKSTEGTREVTNTTTAILKAARDVRQRAEEERLGGDVVGVCVLITPSGGGGGGGKEAEIEEMIMETLGLGWEVVFWDGKATMEEGEKGRRNEFGELQGIPRIIEILGANDWAGDDPLDPEELGLDDDSLVDGGFKLETNELEREMFGLRHAIYGDDGDDGSQEEEDEDFKVQELEGLMERIRGIRDMGKDMPEEERKRFAARAVGEVMKGL